MRLDDHALDRLFREARTHNAWQPRDVSDAILRDILALTASGPTSANCLPMRVVFVKSAAAKERLRLHLAAGNVAKTMTAPVTAIIGNDMAFHEQLPRLFPHTDAQAWFTGKPDHIATTAFRNGTLQAAYMIMAVRAVGLDCGAMSGFDHAGIDAAFFPETTVRSNLLLNIGYGDPAGLFPRSPRLTFDEMASIV